MSVNLPLLAFNDVYRVKQRWVAQPGSPADPKATAESEIRVGQFAKLVESFRDRWPTQAGTDTKDGLFLFAGDVFSPSVESSVTRGSHMVPVLNALHVDAACVGNHDFDFGYPHMTKLVGDTNFPWLLSNVIDANTGGSPAPLKPYVVMERCGVRVGIVGLVEQDWIATIPSWPENFRYRPMKDVALELSKELRDPAGLHRVDIIIALTHSRVPNDIKLANELGAVANKPGVENTHGVDLLIGGHDHIYYIGKGAKSWEGYAGRRDSPSAADDHGVLLIKSGTDFRDLTSANLELSPVNDKAIRRRTITALTGKHNYVLPSSASSPEVDKLVNSLLNTVSKTLNKSVCYSLTTFDARSEIIRTRESSLGNWAADVLLHAYDESLAEGGQVEFEKSGRKETGGADCVIICGGTLRGDSQYGPGTITLGDILEIFPFDDAVVCLEIDGKGIWDTIENGLSRWPAQEGRFPIVSGLAIEWDSALPPGQRVLDIHLTVPDKAEDDSEDPEDLVDFVDQPDGTRIDVKQRKLKLGEKVEKKTGGRMYRCITREYMAGGYDGFDALKGRKFVVDHENGQTMSSIIRSFLLGSTYIYRQKQLAAAHHQYLSEKTVRVLSRARAQHTSPITSAASSPMRNAHFPSPVSPDISMQSMDYSFSSTSTWSILKRHIVQHDWVSIRDAMHIAKHEHMASVEGCKGDDLRKGKLDPPSRSASTDQVGDKLTGLLVDQKRKEELKGLAEDVAIVCPLVDGRLTDITGGDRRA